MGNGGQKAKRVQNTTKANLKWHDKISANRSRSSPAHSLINYMQLDRSNNEHFKYAKQIGLSFQLFCILIPDIYCFIGGAHGLLFIVNSFVSLSAFYL